MAAEDALTTPASPNGVKKLKITRAHTVEVRDIVTGKGLLLPWDPKKIPQDTRDYVILRIPSYLNCYPLL